jgi:hypothetical protein
MNQSVLRHSSLKLPLKDSTNGLSVGVPGRERMPASFYSILKSMACVISGPLWLKSN